MAYSSLSMALGAIFLWVYVYNIVRISLEANSVDMNGSAISDTLKPESVTEPLLLPKDYNTSEDLPYTIFDGKSQQGFAEKLKQNVVKISRKLNLKRLFAPSTNEADEENSKAITLFEKVVCLNDDIEDEAKRVENLV